MRVAAMTMVMAMKAMRRASEAAIGRAAIGLSVRAKHRHIAGAAIAARHQAHRHRADGRTSHQCQHDPTRAFHGPAPPLLPRRGGDRFYHRAPTRQTKARKSRQRAEYLFGSSAGKTKGMRKRTEAAAGYVARSGIGRRAGRGFA